jgi:hypothetical protein
MHLKHVHDTTTILVAPVACQGGAAERPSSKARLARGLNAPSGEVRLARGINTPSGRVRLARGCLHARCPRSCPRAWAFNALTPQAHAATLARPGIASRRYSTNSLGEAIPATV